LNEADKSIRPYLDGAGGKKEEQVVHARELNEYLAHLVEGTIRAMQGLRDSGDFCQLRDELAKNEKNHQGIPAYDSKQETWAADLATEEAIREMAIGDKLNAIVAKKKRTSLAAYFGLIDDFQEEHSGSFYASKAEAEIAPARADLRKVFEEISDLEELGDMYSKFETIKESRKRFAKIPEFDEANERWVVEAKDPEVKKSILAGKAYAAIFEDLAKLKDQLKSSQAKNNKITGPSKRAKAEEKTMTSHLRKLKSLAGKLEKLADKHGDSYYGIAASRSSQAYTDSEGQTLTDKRER
jgi:hypothetical protein